MRLILFDQKVTSDGHIDGHIHILGDEETMDMSFSVTEEESPKYFMGILASWDTESPSNFNINIDKAAVIVGDIDYSLAKLAMNITTTDVDDCLQVALTDVDLTLFNYELVSNGEGAIGCVRPNSGLDTWLVFTNENGSVNKETLFDLRFTAGASYDRSYIDQGFFSYGTSHSRRISAAHIVAKKIGAPGHYVLLNSTMTLNTEAEFDFILPTHVFVRVDKWDLTLFNRRIGTDPESYFLISLREVEQLEAGFGIADGDTTVFDIGTVLNVTADSVSDWKIDFSKFGIVIDDETWATFSGEIQVKADLHHDLFIRSDVESIRFPFDTYLYDDLTLHLAFNVSEEQVSIDVDLFDDNVNTGMKHVLMLNVITNMRLESFDNFTISFDQLKFQWQGKNAHNMDMSGLMFDITEDLLMTLYMDGDMDGEMMKISSIARILDGDDDKYMMMMEMDMLIGEEDMYITMNAGLDTNIPSIIFALQIEDTPYPTSIPSGIPTSIPSAEPTSPSSCPTSRPTITPGAPTPSPTVVPSGEPSSTPSGEPSGVPSSVPTGEPTGVPSSFPSSVPSGFPSSVPSGEPSGVPSSVPTGVPSAIPSSVPSVVPSRVPSAVPSAAPSGYPSSAPSAAPSGSPSSSPSGEPTGVPSLVPSGVPTAVPSSVPSGVPSVVPSSVPSGLPTGVPSSVPSGEPSGKPSSAPTGVPTAEPSSIPSGEPSAVPTSIPSVVPTAVPSSGPSGVPSAVPSALPSSVPTGVPSSVPSGVPTAIPSSVPSAEPTGVPSSLPSGEPSAVPTSLPSGEPSSRPSSVPTCVPTSLPSEVPSSVPSGVPSGRPSSNPSSVPTTSVPTGVPSGVPSSAPSGQPSCAPTPAPSSMPTSPSSSPTHRPTIARGSPTPAPSGMPTSVPSSKPSHTPTIAPTASSIVEISFEQVSIVCTSQYCQYNVFANCRE